jgi:hypothetical protein
LAGASGAAVATFANKHVEAAKAAEARSFFRDMVVYPQIAE